MNIIQGNRINSQPNVVPLCDILLVLLIIFMVVSPALQKGIDIRVPETGVAKEEEALVLTVRDGNSLLLNRLPIRLEELTSRLQELFRNPDRVLFIRAEEECAYSHVVRILDLARDAGIRNLALIPDRFRPGE